MSKAQKELEDIIHDKVSPEDAAKAILSEGPVDDLTWVLTRTKSMLMAMTTSPLLMSWHDDIREAITEIDEALLPFQQPITKEQE